MEGGYIIIARERNNASFTEHQRLPTQTGQIHLLLPTPLRNPGLLTFTFSAFPFNFIYLSFITLIRLPPPSIAICQLPSCPLAPANCYGLTLPTFVYQFIWSAKIGRISLVVATANCYLLFLVFFSIYSEADRFGVG